MAIDRDTWQDARHGSRGDDDGVGPDRISSDTDGVRIGEVAPTIHQLHPEPVQSRLDACPKVFSGALNTLIYGSKAGGG